MHHYRPEGILSPLPFHLTTNHSSLVLNPLPPPTLQHRLVILPLTYCTTSRLRPPSQGGRNRNPKSLNPSSGVSLQPRTPRTISTPPHPTPPPPQSNHQPQHPSPQRQEELEAEEQEEGMKSRSSSRSMQGVSVREGWGWG